MLKFIFLPLFLICLAVVFSACCRIKKGNVPAMPSNAVLIDVRSVEEFSAGALAGAINIPHTEIGEKISSAVPGKETPLYLYCRSGRRVQIAMEILKKQGYSNLVNLGGFEEAKKFMEQVNKK
jgi:phage shock protein E